jgi:hypothetical protein
MESVTVPEQGIVEEYWQVYHNSVKDVMDIFLHLFVPESKVLSKNKPIKWSVLNEKALPVTKEHFLDSKAEAAIQRSLQVETQLAELWTEDTPAGVFKDTDDDTSKDENQIQTTLID